MAKKLDSRSKDILSYRPNIEFVEPEQEPGVIEPIPEPTQAEEVQELRDKVKTLAKAVNVLAAAVQAKVDIKAKNMIIKLDPKADAAVVASFKRMYGHEKINPYEITYEQYKKCKERMREKGESLGQRTALKEEDIQAVKDKISRPTSSLAGTATQDNVLLNEQAGPQPFNQLGGYNTEAARNGGLRPELDSNAQVIEPIDMEVLQAYLVRIFVNAIWEKFFLPLFEGLPVVGDLMPEQLVEIPADGYSAEELVALGVPVFGYPKPEQPQPDTNGSTSEGI
jgi:hypothetical protein